MNKYAKHLTVADIIDAAGSLVRVNILDTLTTKGELSVNEIIEEIGVSQSLTSHHLLMLHKAGYIKKKREGKYILYSIASKKLYQIVVIARTYLNK